MSILTKIMGDPNERELKKIRPIVARINDLEPEIEKLSDEELRGKTAEFRQLIDAAVEDAEDEEEAAKQRNEMLDELLPEAFAVVREAGRRSIGMRHYDVQMIGGIVLHQGKIAEMGTGEGKTLVATLPSYLNALTSLGVHIVTVNDYLAKRDREWMGRIHEFLGLSVGVILTTQNPMGPERREAYQADITYGTNNELGFDYLRDNMAADLALCAQRPLNYAIVDEVDNILIDEARTPLIISGQAEESAEMYAKFARLVPRLKEEEDYLVDLKSHTVAILDPGIEKMERMLGVKNIYADMNLTRYLDNALKAQALFKRDKDYLVRDGEVIIVDEFTGRLMIGRRYNEGLHQAIEAKENVKVQNENRTIATVTFQNYFRLYKKLAGIGLQRPASHPHSPDWKKLQRKKGYFYPSPCQRQAKISRLGLQAPVVSAHKTHRIGCSPFCECCRPYQSSSKNPPLARCARPGQDPILALARARQAPCSMYSVFDF